TLHSSHIKPGMGTCRADICQLGAPCGSSDRTTSKQQKSLLIPCKKLILFEFFCDQSALAAATPDPAHTKPGIGNCRADVCQLGAPCGSSDRTTSKQQKSLLIPYKKLILFEIFEDQSV